MAVDLTLETRQAIVSTLSPLFERVYGPKVVAQPVWPFVRVTVTQAEQQFAQCYAGSRLQVQVSCFSKTSDESEAVTMGARVVEALDAKSPARWIRRIKWLRSQTVRDTDEAGAWHQVVQFEVNAAVNT